MEVNGMINEQFTIKELDAFCKLNNKIIKIRANYENKERIISFSIEDEMSEV